MTLSTIRTLVTDFGIYLDNYRGDSPTAAELTAQTNWGIRVFARKLNLFDPRIAFTLNPVTSSNSAKFYIRDTVGLAAGPYTATTPATPVVAKRVIKPYGVYISGKPLYDWNGNVGLWSLSQLENDVPSWRTENAGTATKAVYVGNGMLLLSAPPSAVGSNNFISGTYIPTDLINSTDDANSPDLPDELHEALAYFVAQHAGMPTATEQEQWSKLAAYKGEWMDLVNEIAMENRNAIEGPWTDTGWASGQEMNV